MTIRFTAREMTPPGARTHEAIVRLHWESLESDEAGSSSRAYLVSWIDDEGGRAVVGPRNTPVVTVHPANRPAYLQSKANGVLNDNLLSLPEIRPR